MQMPTGQCSSRENRLPRICAAMPGVGLAAWEKAFCTPKNVQHKWGLCCIFLVGVPRRSQCFLFGVG